MYKKILFIIMVAFGMFTVVGCHEDNDESMEFVEKKYDWQTKEKIVADVYSIRDGKVYFRILDGVNGFDSNKFNETEVFLLTASSWFDEKAWPTPLKTWDVVSFMVEKIEWKVYPNQIGNGGSPNDVHFYIVPCE